MRTLLSLTAMLGLVGCVGGLEQPGPTPDDDNPNQPTTPPPPTGTARAAFETGVYPIIEAKCKGCHENGATKGGAPATSGFVGSSLTGAYDIMIDHPNIHGNFAGNARLLTYVTQTGHQGLSYETTEISTIDHWLATELAERAGGTGPGQDPMGPGATTERILNSFSACMTIDLFNQANMAQACGAMQGSNNTECDNCHVTGGEGFAASRVATQMFKTISEHRSYLQKYFMVANAETPTAAKMDRNLPTFEAVLGRQNQYFEHPTVNNGSPTNNTCTQAMQTFLTSVQARIDADPAACGPSKFID